MCGRFTLTVSHKELLARYSVTEVTNFYHYPRYNIAPMQMVPAIVNDGRQNRIGLLRWGLIPSWAKDERIAAKTINAKAETLLEKASFKHLLYKKRCVIPADSFYEWKNASGKRLPMRIMMKDDGIFSMAGLYDTWVNSANGQTLHTFTIITIKPNQLVAEFHDRMPVILNKQEEGKWLAREKSTVEEVLALLKPYPAEEMKAYPVSSVVGNVRNDIPECIKPLQGHT